MTQPNFPNKELSKCPNCKFLGVQQSTGFDVYRHSGVSDMVSLQIDDLDTYNESIRYLTTIRSTDDITDKARICAEAYLEFKEYF
jgi:hypothetical protein